MASRKVIWGVGIVVVVIGGLWLFGSRDDDELSPPNPVDIKVPGLVGDAEQVVVVTSDDWSSTFGEVAVFERRAGRGWAKVGGDYQARLGTNGFRIERHEGDGTTPAGSFALVSSFGGPANPGSKLPYRQVGVEDCWISDVTSPAYNRWVLDAGCAEPNVDLFERSTTDLLYAIVPAFNMPAQPGVGSAVFMHQYDTSESGQSEPTAGSVTVSRKNLLDILRWLDPEKRPTLIMGPSEWLETAPAEPEDTTPSTTAAPETDDTTWTTLRPGDTGSSVVALQQALTEALLPTVADGVYGSQTEANVRAFQLQENLTVDGIVGTETARALGLID
jgi:L,D-peptidoglycan transpeptidase YkuD (ErfK/YbiS/YcfS/YnhG family)